MLISIANNLSVIEVINLLIDDLHEQRLLRHIWHTSVLL